MLLESGIGAQHKDLKAYLCNAMWLAEPHGAYLAIMLRVVEVLLGQHEDQPKCGFPSTFNHYIQQMGGS